MSIFRRLETLLDIVFEKKSRRGSEDHSTVLIDYDGGIIVNFGLIGDRGKFEVCSQSYEKGYFKSNLREFIKG